MQTYIPPSENDLKVHNIQQSARFSGGVSDIFEVLLTHEQFKLIQKLLPVGYFLNVSNKSNTKRQNRPGPSKEVSTEQRVSLAQQKTSRKPAIFLDKGEDQDYLQSNFVKIAENMLKSLMAHRSAIPFLHPVDYKALRIPDYPTIVKEPMDLSSVQKKLDSRLYATMTDIERDIRLIWSNAFLYNPVGTQVYKLTEEMSKYFEKIMTQIKGNSEFSAASKKSFQEDISKKEDKPMASSQVTRDKLKPLTKEEKRNLAIMIRQLPETYLSGVLDIVSLNNEGTSNTLHFDIETLPVAIARKLETYVKSHINLGNKSKHSAQPQAPRNQNQNAYGNNRDQMTHRVISEESTFQQLPPATQNRNNNESESDFISSIDDSDF